MTTAPSLARRLSAIVERACGIICAVSLFAMMALTFVDVLGRYIFSFPIYGSVEIVGILLAVLVFSGLCIAVRRDDHIAVELFGPSQGVAGRVLRHAIQITSVLALGVIVYVLAHEAASDFERGVGMLILDLQRGYVTASLAVLAGLSFIMQLAMLFVGNLGDSAEGAA